MGGCCEPTGYDAMFGARFSRQLTRRYRKRGLDRNARRIADFLSAHGIDGASVLEIGGGVGDLQLELLRRGAARATNLEMVGVYDGDAMALAGEAGVADRVVRRQVDLARSPDAVAPHDVVVLHRVVCCYPDSEALVAAAADRATRLLVFSYPPRTLVNRALLVVENLLFRLRRMTFRTYLHDPDALVAAAQRGRLREAYRHRGLAWHVVGLSVPAA